MESTPRLALSKSNVLSLQNISRDFETLEVLKNVSMEIMTSEVHALVGEHGAGKSTLAMIISGMLKPKSGTIEYFGKRFNNVNLSLTNRLGIKMVYQQVFLNDHFTVAENLFYTDPNVSPVFWNSTKKMRIAAAELLRRSEIDISPSAKLKTLSLSDRTVVDILKQISTEPRLLILDEALEKLSSQALSKIVPILLERKKVGMSVLFVTHRIDDIYNFADKVSIIRNGQLVFAGATGDIDKIKLLRLAYTQVSQHSTVELTSSDFMDFLKYNEAILEHLPISLLVTDTGNRVKLANENFKSAFSLTQRDYLNAPVVNVLTGLPAFAAENLTRALDAQSELTIYNVSLSLNGKTTLNNLKTLPIFDVGMHIGNILVIEDITDYDKLQRQVILSDKLASVGFLAAGVAHEINNPLEIIYNYLSFLRRRTRDSDLREAVNRLRDEFSYISAIVSNLVNLASPQRIGTENVNLNEAIGKVIELLTYSAKSRKTRIEFKPSATEVRAEINGNELKQVVLNLVRNAFEAMADGGTVRVVIQRREEEGQSFAEVAVEDTGPGISAENLDDIFLPFYSTKRVQGTNMGLGLSVSYALLERYNGKLKAENLPAGGCRLTITLPQGPALGVP